MSSRFTPLEERPYVVPGLGRVHRLVEHLYSSDHRLTGGADAYYLYLLVESYLPVSTRPVATVPRPWMVNTSSTAKQEVPVYVPLGLGHVLIHSPHQLQYGLLPVLSLISIKSLKGASYHHGDVITRELVLRKELPDLHLHQLQVARGHRPCLPC